MEKTGAGKNRLRKNGLKSTKHRTEVLRILEQSSQPVTADWVYRKLEAEGKNISLSTVYRNLELLVAKEIVLKMNAVEGGKALFELNQMIHRHYLICLGCHKMFPIDDCPLDEYEKTLQQKTGFSVTGHKLEIYGYCRDCAIRERNGK